MLKKIPFWLVLTSVFVACVALVSFTRAETKQLDSAPLVRHGTELLAFDKKLSLLSARLAILGRRDKPVLKAELAEGVNRVSEILGNVSDVLYYEGHLLIMIPHLKDEHKPTFSKIRIDHLSRSKSILNIHVPELQYYYENEPYKNVLAAAENGLSILKESLSVIANAEKELASMAKKDKE